MIPFEPMKLVKTTNVLDILVNIDIYVVSGAYY